MSTLTRGERFKDARIVHNQNGKQTMKEVEHDTGISASLIKDLEDDSSTRGVSFEKVAKLSHHYGVSSDWLLSLTNDPFRLTTAVDELPLSCNVVRQLKKIKADDLEEEKYDGPAFRTTDALNAYLEHALNYLIYTRIAVIEGKVKGLFDAEIPKDLRPHASVVKQVGQRMAENISVSAKLSYELFESHPELAGLVKVYYGDEYIKQEIDLVCMDFRRCIEEITGYRDYIKSRPF